MSRTGRPPASPSCCGDFLVEDSLQLERVDRFHQMTVKSRVARSFEVLRLAIAGECYQPAPAQFAHAAHGQRNLKAAHARQSDVEQNDRGHERLRDFQRRGAVVRGAHLLAARHEHGGDTLRRVGYWLLFWSGLCFAGLTVNNALLVLDKTVFSTSADLLTWRLAAALVALVPLLFGLIWEDD